MTTTSLTKTSRPSIYLDVLAISKNFPGILLDAYGVFWDSGIIPGATKVMQELVNSGKIVGILSNSSQPALNEVNKFHKHGLEQGKHFHFVVTSGHIARQIFLEEKLPFPLTYKKFFVHGEPHPEFALHQALFENSSFLETTDIKKADFIYISIPHINGKDQTDPTLFKERATHLAQYGLPMVCVNPDYFAHEGKPSIPVVRQGSIARMYEEAGGKVFYIGKPSPIAFKAAMSHFEIHNIKLPSLILMVGDTPETDIRGAKNFGMASALITQTGIASEKIAESSLDEFLKKLPEKDRPQFCIERLGQP